MESGERPRSALPAGAHITKHASIAHWLTGSPSMESGTRPKFTPTAVALLTQHTSSAHWHVYGIRNEPQIYSTCWCSPYSTRIQHSLAPSMESGMHPRLAPPAGTHFTHAHPALTGTIYGIRYAPQTGSTCWHSLYSTRIQRSLASSMESGTSPRLAPSAGAHFMY